MAHNNEPLEAVQPPPRPCTVACDAPQPVEGMPIAPVKSPPQHALHADSTRGTLSTHSAVVGAARRHHPSVCPFLFMPWRAQERGGDPYLRSHRSAAGRRPVGIAGRAALATTRLTCYRSDVGFE
jgi:hypothetical protein